MSHKNIHAHKPMGSYFQTWVKSMLFDIFQDMHRNCQVQETALCSRKNINKHDVTIKLSGWLVSLGSYQAITWMVLLNWPASGISWLFLNYLPWFYILFIHFLWGMSSFIFPYWNVRRDIGMLCKHDFYLHGFLFACEWQLISFIFPMWVKINLNGCHKKSVPSLRLVW